MLMANQLHETSASTFEDSAHLGQTIRRPGKKW